MIPPFLFSGLDPFFLSLELIVFLLFVFGLVVESEGCLFFLFFGD